MPGSGLPGSAAHVFVTDLSAPVLSAEDRHHLSGVLRLRAGEVVTASDGRGAWRPCRLGPGAALVEDGAVVSEERPGPAITIAFPPVKGARTEWAVQKLTEVGVDRIRLLAVERAVVRWEASRAARQLERLRTVARHAAMQCRRVWLPELGGLDAFQALAVGTTGGAGAAIALQGGSPPSLAWPTVLVGPEGGWSPSEEAVALARVGLGPHVLRTETAALVAGTLLVALRSGVLRER